MQARVDSKNRPFLAWDGEGWSDNDGLDHHYMLFGNSNGTHIAAPQLTSLECLELLLKEASKNPKVIHIWYGGGYDATHILRDIPLALTAKLKDNNTIHWNVPKSPGIAPNTFSINYVPHKWFEVRGYDWYTTRWVTIRIYDIMTYFQTSAIKAWESRKLKMSEAVRSGKASRSTFTWDDLDEVLSYMTEELQLYVELADTLRQEMQDADVYVTQWHGPATIAKAFMRRHKIKQFMQLPEPHIERLAQHAYFGGHFEQYKAGHHNGRVWLYDINSAYPHHIRNLPDLAGSTWAHRNTFTGELGMWRCRYTNIHHSHHTPHPLPWRSKTGAVGFPTDLTEVWLWTPEASITGIEIIEGYALTPGSDVKPFAYITELYELRKQWQTIGRGGEKALKLGLNSSYGVMAQRIGGIPDIRGGRPTYHQLEWAGLVTSGTRRQLWDAISQKPESVIAVETDSIMTTAPLELDIGTGLGQWGVTEYDYVTYIQNGIYFTGTDQSGTVASKPASKTRGIDATKLDYGEVMAYLAGDQLDPLLVSSRNFIGLGNPRTQLYGMWQDSTKEVRVAGQKRIHSSADCTACSNGTTMATSLHDLIAAPHYGTVPSTPHPLPWLDGPTSITDDVQYAGDVIEEYEPERRR